MVRSVLENVSGNQKPRLLVTTSTLPAFENDPEPRFVLDLARALSDRFDVTLLAPSFPGATRYSRLFGIDVIRFRYAPFRSWERLAYPGGIMSRLRAAPQNWILVPGFIIAQAFATRRLLASRGFDLIHAHWIVPQGLIAATLPRELRIPFVATSHGGDVYTLGRGPFKRALRYVLRQAASVTVVSEEIKKTCESIAGPGEKGLDIHCIPMGVDVDFFARAAADESRPSDLPREGPVILFVGRLAQKKGVRVLVDALSQRRELSTAQLVIIGDGPLLESLLAHVEAGALSHRVHFLGARDHQQLPAYMASSDVIAVPSIEASDGDKDGLPVTVLEAAACSLPSVASNIGGIPEFITDGYNGLLVRPGDSKALANALVRLLTDQARRDAFAKAALTTARAFDWRVVSDQFSKIFFNALTGNIERQLGMKLSTASTAKRGSSGVGPGTDTTGSGS